VIPAGVLAPYERGSGTGREVRSQAERDNQSRELAIRRGKVKREIERQLADERLTPESRDLLNWYAEEAGKAQTLARLGDLIEQAGGEQLQRRHWWQGAPAALDAGYDDDDGQDDDDGDYYEDDDGALAATGAAARTGYTAAMTARGYLVDRAAAPGGCQIFETSAGPGCGLAAVTALGGARVCELHRAALTPRLRSVPG
jgi:hypothetical protein